MARNKYQPKINYIQNGPYDSVEVTPLGEDAAVRDVMKGMGKGAKSVAAPFALSEVVGVQAKDMGVRATSDAGDLTPVDVVAPDLWTEVQDLVTDTATTLPGAMSTLAVDVPVEALSVAPTALAAAGVVPTVTAAPVFFEAAAPVAAAPTADAVLAAVPDNGNDGEGNPEGDSGDGNDGEGNPDGDSGDGNDGEGNPDGDSGDGNNGEGNPDGGSGEGNDGAGNSDSSGDGSGDGNQGTTGAGNGNQGEGNADSPGGGTGDGNQGDTAGVNGKGDGTGEGDGISDKPPPAPTPPDVLVQDRETADHRSTYKFNLDDITGDFDGGTVATNPDIIDWDTSKFTKDGAELHPVDSQFGFYTTDFVGGAQKDYDGVYEEGWAGLSPDGDLVVSNARTATLSTPALLGSWLEGIGGNTVKASTEHYSVMQAILSDQAYPGDTSGFYQLDDDLWIVDYMADDVGMPTDETGAPSDSLVEGVMHGYYVYELAEALADAAGNIEAAPVSLFKDFDRDGTAEEFHAYMADIDIDGYVRTVAAVDLDRDGEVDYFDNGLNGFGTFGLADILKPNESSVIQDIAVGDDYSVTLKDDGKLLYRWGNAIKRPNDMRLDAKMDLPEEWTVAEDDGLLPLFRVTAAELVVNHTVTNNPNDQIRPEDFENEAAIGQLPTYEVNDLGQWVSVEGVYSGDGTYYPAGTVLRDPALAELARGSTSPTIGAVQEVTALDDVPRTIAYQDGHTFLNPVVFASPLSFNGSDASAVRFSDVSSSGATLFVAEADMHDGIHLMPETVSLVTFEEGSWTLADGSQIEVGTVETDMLAQNGFVSVSFAEAFDEAPSILLQVQTNIGTQWVVMRARNVTESGFELAMQEQEDQDSLPGLADYHFNEIVGWAAIDASAVSGLMEFGDITAQAFDTGTVVTHLPTDWTFDAALGDDPLIAASISSFVGDNTATLRLDGVTSDSGAATATFVVQEEQSLDDEVVHLPENVSGIAFSGTGLLAAAPSEESMLSIIGAMSSDLEGGFTEAWYTTMDREPFMALLDENGDYVIGPRWRLQPDKYGQDLPSVTIPQDTSDPPPIQNGEEMYETGADTTTVLNLLDWNGTSPLTLSAGWLGTGVSDNGVNMTDSFDVAYYVKGDMKPVTLYDAELVMSYEAVEIHAETAFIDGSTADDVLVGRGSNTFHLSGETFSGADSMADIAVLGYGTTTAAAMGSNDIYGFGVEEDALGLIGFDLDPDNYNVHITQEVTADDDLLVSYEGTQIATLYGVTEYLEADDFYFA